MLFCQMNSWLRGPLCWISWMICWIFSKILPTIRHPGHSFLKTRTSPSMSEGILIRGLRFLRCFYSQCSWEDFIKFQKSSPLSASSYFLRLTTLLTWFKCTPSSEYPLKRSSTGCTSFKFKTLTSMPILSSSILNFRLSSPFVLLINRCTSVLSYFLKSPSIFFMLSRSLLPILSRLVAITNCEDEALTVRMKLSSQIQLQTMLTGSRVLSPMNFLLASIFQYEERYSLRNGSPRTLYLLSGAMSLLLRIQRLPGINSRESASCFSLTRRQVLLEEVDCSFSCRYSTSRAENCPSGRYVITTFWLSVTPFSTFSRDSCVAMCGGTLKFESSCIQLFWIRWSYLSQTSLHFPLVLKHTTRP